LPGFVELAAGIDGAFDPAIVLRNNYSIFYKKSNHFYPVLQILYNMSISYFCPAKQDFFFAKTFVFPTKAPKTAFVDLSHKIQWDQTSV